jgi:o-succinylbenzoate synthase
VSPARIERLELLPFALPFGRPYVTARGRLDQRELLLVRLHTDGLTGLGEAAPLALRGGPGLAQLAAELERAGEALAGREVSTALADELDVSAQARSGLDLALHDLAGKLAGEPVWKLLGAKRARPVQCNATLSAGDPADVASWANEWVTQGFRTVKLKVGDGADVEQVAAVRTAVGGEVRIRVDANGTWTAEQAIATLAEMESYWIELAEQPAPDLDGLVTVRAGTSIPVAADESVVTVADAGRAVELGACDMATVKLAKVGGIRASLDIAARIPVYLSSALDGPLGIAAAAHVAQCLPESSRSLGLDHGLATSELFREDVARDEPTMIGPALHVPEGPGLGVDIDDRALESHRL